MAFYTNGVVPWNSLDDNTRAPLASELESGYPCGEADQQLFNWTAGYPIGQIYNALLGAGITTPNLSNLKQLAQAIQSGSMIYAQATGTANALVLTLSNAPINYAQLRMIIVNAVSANTRSSVTINVNGLGARNIVRRGGSALRKGDIQPGPMILVDNGTAYELVGTSGLYRTAMNANLELYVSTTGSDSANDGLSAAAPFQTLQRAWSEVVNNYDLNGFTANINIADGTYSQGIFASSAPLGGNSGVSAVTFKSSSGNASAVIISKTTGGNLFYAQGGAQYILKDLTVQCSGASGNAVVSGIGGIIAVDNVRFGTCTGSHMYSISGGFIQASGNYSIVGAAQYHVLATSMGQVLLPSRTITITGTPAFSAFAYCSQARVDCTGTTFSGSATGSRYFIEQNGVITVNGAGVNLLPGNAAGTVQTGGQYV